MIQYRRKVNYYETDQMGIVHHSNYIRYFEEARLEWMESIGISYSELEKMGIIIPVTFVDCQYQKPLHYGDEVEICVHFTKFNGIKMEFSYEATDARTGEVCTKARTGHCFLRSDLKPFLIKKKHPEIYEKLCSVLNEDGGTLKGREMRSL